MEDQKLIGFLGIPMWILIPPPIILALVVVLRFVARAREPGEDPTAGTGKASDSP